MKLHHLSRKSCRSAVGYMRVCFKVLLVVFVVEGVIFNCIGLFILFRLKDSITAIMDAPGSNIIDKLAVNPMFKEAVRLGKDGGFVSLMQHTIGRLYFESIDSPLQDRGMKRRDQSIRGLNGLHSLSKVGVDVSGAGEALYIYQRLQQRKITTQFQQLVVDIGANDGFMSSNSFNFIQWGWEAILVEPQASQLKLAERNTMRIKQSSDQVRFLQAVIDDHDGYIQFKLVSDIVSMESHVVRDNADHDDDAVTHVQCYSVKTFAKRYNVPKYFGILSLDAEGSNSKILHQWIKLGYRPVYIIYEELHDPERLVNTRSWLAKAGYQYLIKKGWNHIFEYTFPASNTTSPHI